MPFPDLIILDFTDIDRHISMEIHIYNIRNVPIVGDFIFSEFRLLIVSQSLSLSASLAVLLLIMAITSYFS